METSHFQQLEQRLNRLSQRIERETQERLDVLSLQFMRQAEQQLQQWLEEATQQWLEQAMGSASNTTSGGTASLLQGLLEPLVPGRQSRHDVQSAEKQRQLLSQRNS